MHNYICINNGYYNTKVCNEFGVKHVFESTIGQVLDVNDTETVTLNGKTYKVGVSGGKRDLALDKSNNVTQEACIKYAKEKFTGSHIDTVFSCMSINQYINPVARAQYETLLRKYFDNVYVAMEGFISVLADEEIFKDECVVLADLGGLTLDTLVIEDNKIKDESPQSANLGIIHYQNLARTWYQQTYAEEVADSALNQVTKRFGDKVIDDYMKEIEQHFKSNKYPSINLARYKFVGGGAVLLKDKLQEHFPGCIIADGDTPLWENVLGLKALADNLPR